VTGSAVLEKFAKAVGVEGAVSIAGSRTRWNSGGALASDARVLAAPAGIVEHQPDEMTVRVRAGTSVAELHDALAAAKQRTAVPERGGTVGGALAVGENDLHVLRRGRVRDALLQLRYVSSDGRLITAGGPTVKNVTGFDLPRLMVGSLGTLGLFAEVVLRTKPIGEADQWFAADGADPFAAFRALYRPSAVLWNGERTWVHLEGHAGDVARALSSLKAVGSFEPVEGPPALPPHRWSLRPSQLQTIADLATGPFVASIGVGLVHATEPQAEAPRASAVARRVKELFDPTGRLNPGRRPGVTL
jgi:glycolate oxidase FAD binding subunit